MTARHLRLLATLGLLPAVAGFALVLFCGGKQSSVVRRDLGTVDL